MAADRAEPSPAYSAPSVAGRAARKEGIDKAGLRWQSWFAMNTFLGLLLM